MSYRVNTAELREGVAISSIISQHVQLRREGPRWKGCCPFHQDRTPSFYADDRTGRYWCLGCDTKGDLLDFVMRLHTVDFSAAVALVTGSYFSNVSRPVPTKPSKDDDRSGPARDIWAKASLAQGTLVERYLAKRGIITGELPFIENIRFAKLPYQRSPEVLPALVAAIRDLSGRVTGIQRTYLSEDGAKLAVDKPKLSLGVIRGNAIQLGEAAETMIVCEGLEDGLSVWRAMHPVPVWVAAGAGNMAAMRLPDICREIIIASDNDPAGRKAADAAADAFQAQGRQPRIMRPAPQFKDFNDQLRKENSL